MTTPPTSSSSTARPQMPAARVAMGLFNEAAAHRVELATLELEEAREQLAGFTLLASVFAALALLAGFAFTLLVAGLVWDLPHRGWWLGGLCLLYLATAATAGFTLVRRLRVWRPLGEIRTQLREDYQCLTHLIRSIAP